MISSYTGVSGSRIAYYIANEFKNKGNLLIVVPTGKSAQRLSEDLGFFMPNINILVMQEEDKNRIVYEKRDKNILNQRIKLIAALVNEENNENNIVIIPASSSLRPMVSKKRFISRIIDIYPGMKIEPNELKEMLFDSGYENSVVTESVGEVTSRGGIIDIFPPNLDNPIRVDFFDDEIESIREFDNISQRSLQKLEKVSIFPAVDFIPTEKEKDIAYKNIIKTDNQIAELIKNGADPQIYSDYFEYFELENNYIWNYLGNGISVVIEPEIIRQQIDDSKLFNKFSNIFSTNCAVFSSLQETIKEIDKFDKITNIKSGQVVSFNGNLKLLSSEIKNYLKRKYLVNIVSSSKERSDRIREYLELEDIYGNISYKLGALTSGMVLEDEKICYITENDIFPQLHKKYKRKNKKTKDSLEFSDIHAGDFVVHEEHGIGKFEGIKTLTADGQERDYLEIRYAGTDVLYIPTEQLDVIQRYIGSGGHGPALSRLSGGSWRSTKEKARKAIMEIAEDLVKLYAERKESGGHAFSEDNVWQTEFEEAFPYTETDDQLNAILEIKEDMMKPLPMDRLLCGDVGYGKTEVAARAIFKCLSEGKQVAFLAPTTLLVNQHYHNFIERFEGFPFEIGELSRFRTSSQQQKIIKGLENGSIDFVIGTHRLLSDDVKFKDLGLLVVDEEQRFGVQHKEKIKKLRNNVDVLTLSATPIPRTLNMSLTGIKDITTINEPPGERYPVQTFVNSYDENVIKIALQNELNRGGQVFVINNRITGINKIVQKISELIPNANIGVCHGRMTEVALENTMKDFIDGKINVLVSTTIIENGIDIPNANTIIIFNADRFGLSQLYQLRGRVGRSNRIAYAYLMYQPQKILTEIAAKRLMAIKEFTEFGSGFKIAMRDLELRGAGNILGEAQSGHIEGIGYELYCKEIDRAVRILKGEKIRETIHDVNLNISIKALIPDNYIEDESLKLESYRKIALITNKKDTDDIIEELIDRYGELPTEVLNLVKISEIRANCEILGISLINKRQKDFELFFAKENFIDALTLVLTKEKIGDSLRIVQARKPGLILKIAKKDGIDELLVLLRTMREIFDSSQKV